MLLTVVALLVVSIIVGCWLLVVGCWLLVVGFGERVLVRWGQSMRGLGCWR